MKVVRTSFSCNVCMAEISDDHEGVTEEQVMKSFKWMKQGKDLHFCSGACAYHYRTELKKKELS